jgi:predicted transposase/invertase (TIGR01784 family)
MATDPPPNSPHDALFRYTFGHPEHAAALLRGMLPLEVAAEIDCTSLQRLPGTRVDKRLRRHQSDLLFRTRLGGKSALVYVLIEHKRRAERWAVLQLLDYTVGLWRDLRRRQRHLPFVVPILVLQEHGPDTVDSVAQLLEPFDASRPWHEAIADLQPRFQPVVVRLRAWAADHLRMLSLSVMARLTVEAMVALPRASEAAVVALFAGWAPLLRRLLRERAGDEALAAWWSYVVEVAEVTADRLLEVVEEIMDSVDTKKFKTPAAQWREQGRQQGRQEGRQEGAVAGRCQLLARQLEARFGPLPESMLQQLASASVPQLDGWAIRLLDASSLADVFGG